MILTATDFNFYFHCKSKYEKYFNRLLYLLYIIVVIYGIMFFAIYYIMGLRSSIILVFLIWPFFAITSSVYRSIFYIIEVKVEAGHGYLRFVKYSKIYTLELQNIGLLKRHVKYNNLNDFVLIISSKNESVILVKQYETIEWKGKLMDKFIDSMKKNNLS